RTAFAATATSAIGTSLAQMHFAALSSKTTLHAIGFSHRRRRHELTKLFNLLVGELQFLLHVGTHEQRHHLRSAHSPHHLATWSLHGRGSITIVIWRRPVLCESTRAHREQRHHADQPENSFCLHLVSFIERFPAPYDTTLTVRYLEVMRFRRSFQVPQLPI